MEIINLFINQIKSCFFFQTETTIGKAGASLNDDRETPLLENEMRPVNAPVYIYEAKFIPIGQESKGYIYEDSKAPSECSINYDSDIENDDCGAYDDDILEFDNNSHYYKMDSILTILEHNTLLDIIKYVEENHKNIPVNSKSTIASITQALLKDAYENSSERKIVATMSRVRDIINNQTESLNQKAKRFSELRQILRKRFGEDSKIVKKDQSLGISHK